MKKDTIAVLIVFVVLIGGSTLIYNNYKAQSGVSAPLSTDTKPQNTKPDNTEAKSTPANTQEEQEKQEQEQEEQDMQAPDFTVTDKDGNEVKLSSLFGKPIVLNFWASWCPPCKSEMPEFQKVYEDLGDEVQFVMIDSVDGQRETKENGEKYINENGFTFPVYYDLIYNNDGDKQTASFGDAVVNYGIRAFPTSVFIDKDGNVVTGAEGAINEETLRKGIDLIMNSETQSATYKTITPEDAKKIIEGTEPYVLLDVRTQSEFDEGHIKGAKLIPDFEIVEKSSTELPDKDALIIIYCRSGARSAGASKALISMGYTNVYDLGGIIDWPYETVKN